MEASSWVKIILAIVIIYMIMAVINLMLFGWNGILPFLRGPLIMILGISDGIIKYAASK